MSNHGLTLVQWWRTLWRLGLDAGREPMWTAACDCGRWNYTIAAEDPQEAVDRYGSHVASVATEIRGPNG